MSESEKAVPLITFNNEKRYQLHPLGLRFLKSLPCNENYAIMTIAGKSKSGKSFLLNQILQDENIFPVSSHINGCTKGIMIAQKVLEINDTKVLLLDTQGFGSFQSDEDADYKFLMIAILISSMIIYNSMGTIDQQAINGISLVIEVAKTMQKQIGKDCNFGTPSFMWVLRDFTLKLEDKSGELITPKQYLQNALEQQKGLSQQANHKNRVRRAIKTLFPNRNCQTLVVPYQLQTSMVNFENTEIRKQFRDDIARLKKKICKMIESTPHRLGKNLITITNLIYCLQLIITSLNTQNSIPKINNLSHQVTKKQAAQLKKQFAQTLQSKKYQFLTLLQSQQEEQVMRKIENIYLNSQKSLHNLLGQNQDLQLIQIKSKFIQIIHQIKRTQAIQNAKQDQQLLAHFCQYISKINEERQLESEYGRSIREFRGMIRQQNFTAGLMKIEIAYLKRKVELNKQTDVQKEKLKLQLFYAKRQIQQLKSKLSEYQSQNIAKNNILVQSQQQKINQQRKVLKNGFIKNNGQNNQYQTQNQYQSSSKKIQNGSFYVPYVIIDSPDDIVIEITKTLIKQDSKLNSYIEYVLEVTVNGFKWNLNRKYKDFCQLGNILTIMFPKAQLPSFQTIISASRTQIANINKNQKIEQRRRDLEEYLGDLLQIQFIRNSRILQKFVKLNKQYMNSVLNV